MRPLIAPAGQMIHEVGHTRGSIPYAVAAHCQNAPSAVILTKANDVERIASEVELWTNTLSKKSPKTPKNRPSGDFIKPSITSETKASLRQNPGAAQQDTAAYRAIREDTPASSNTDIAQDRRVSVVIFPTLPEIILEEDKDPSLMLQRQEKQIDLLGALGELTQTISPTIIVADIDAITQPLPPKSSLISVSLKKGQKVNLEHLKQELSQTLHYSCEALCEGPAQYAVRGGIIDIYPVNATEPIRIELFGDEIDNMRYFDPTSQRTIKEMSSVSELQIAPGQVDADWRSGAITEYLAEGNLWCVIEPATLAEAHPDAFNIPDKIKAPRGHFSYLLERTGDRWISLSAIEQDCPFASLAEVNSIEVHSPSRYRPLPEAGLVGDERAKADKAMFTRMIAALKAEAPDAQCTLFHRGEVSEELHSALTPLKPTHIEGAISEGFIISQNSSKNSKNKPSGDYRKSITDQTQRGLEQGAGAAQQDHQVSPVIALSPADLPPYASVYTITRKSRKIARHSVVNELLDFSSVAKGDYLVHLEHGICIYQGINKLDDGQEVLSLEFDENVVLHLRFSESHLISRYVGLSKKKPRLNKIGSASWSRAKSAARAATLDFAAELLRLQAVRESTPGFAFPPDAELEAHFDASFPHRLTPDQEKSIAAAKEDMMLAQPMDRLVCGDVGFGKTEVALRAAVKAVAGGKQVAIVAPTTILSEQHFRTFRERAESLGVVVECLNRFRKPMQQKAILTQLAMGRIDVVVGTHRLLSKDVIFKDLGLIIIDEEHRFGVDQKEHLKRLRINVDVMSMSATPIPRTLQMALGGARELSVIETAPQNRRPIETIVKNFDEKTLKDAINYEIGRGGQVFYLHNRVRSIGTVAMRLQELFPKLRIGVGHGKMSESELEEVMADFVAGRLDLLVCTTIIENGLDIPNCNTLIIEDADKFGLAQLYQIRGRVGRFNRQAYAYFFLHKNKTLTSEARNRLEALRQHNELGSGFRIAMRDLELRGTGNLLGPQQSGHVAGIGFELYCQLLRESINRLKRGSKGAQAISPKAEMVSRTTVRFDFDYPIQIPISYIEEARLRLEVHRELSVCDSLTELNDITEGLTDRYGRPPQSVKNLILLNKVRILAQKHNFANVVADGDKLKMQYANTDTPSYYKSGSLFPRIPQEMTGPQKAAFVANMLKNLDTRS